MTPILSIPNAANSDETIAASSLLETATHLEGILSDRLWDMPQLQPNDVTSPGVNDVVVLQQERLTPEFREELRQISYAMRPYIDGSSGFLSDMAQRIRLAAWAADSMEEKTAFARVVRRFTEDQNLLWYSPLIQALTDREKGLAYFFGLHYRPVLRSSDPVVLGEKLTDVGFGVTAALSLFLGLKKLTDLNEGEGFINPLTRDTPAQQSENGWTIG